MFEERFNELLKGAGTSLYKVSLSINEDPSRVSQIVYKRKPVTFEKRLEILAKISMSPLLKAIDFGTLAGWLALDYLPTEAVRSAYNEVEAEFGTGG